MKDLKLHLFLISIIVSIGMLSCDRCCENSLSYGKLHTIPKSELFDKIKGGWAGQTIGVCYGASTEYGYQSRVIPNYVTIGWSDDLVDKYFNNDDIYMDLCFVEVFERLGFDAPADSFAIAFATAGFGLCEANQAARYNILNGIMPPASGHWRNTLHADDIDFQIEADFAGLMSPGIINSSAEICDKIGHIMNSGDGWYSGVYVAGLYSLAFVSDDMDFIVREALKLIPEESNYYKCMKDVIDWCEKYPDDWRQTWFEIERSDWAQTLHCPSGIFSPFTIDATVNMAYVLVGLLYGEKDMYQTMDISMRCGQDSDCNPSTAAGVLGTMLGYSNISDYWKNPLEKADTIDFKFTTLSLQKCYKTGLKHALENITRNGGKEESDNVFIKLQKPKKLPLELAYPNIYANKRTRVNKSLKETVKIDFEGTGIAVIGTGFGFSNRDAEYRKHISEIEIKLDDSESIVRKYPFSVNGRSLELFFKLELPKGKHTVELKWLNPIEDPDLKLIEYITYSDELPSFPRPEM